MIQWFIENVKPADIIALVTALTGFAVAICSLVKSHHVKKAVQEAKKNGYWTECPECKSIISLKELHIYMPNGQEDSDLDGVAD